MVFISDLLGGGNRVRYTWCPFQREPDFGVTSLNHDFPEFLARAFRSEHAIVYTEYVIWRPKKSAFESSVRTSRAIWKAASRSPSPVMGKRSVFTFPRRSAAGRRESRPC